MLVDTGVISSSDFLVGDSRIQELRWGSGFARTTIAGFRRVDLDRDIEQQLEKNALFTIGRLARSGIITLHTYSELTVEVWRRPRGREPFVNAFEQCNFLQCPAPVERSKFRTTLDMKEWMAKGGNSDKEKGLSSSEFSQISFFEWLSNLSPAEIGAVVSNPKLFELEDSELLSLQDLPFFQALARAFIGRENLPDCFHIWTARRNGLDVFLTLEKKLPRTIEQIKNRSKGAIDTSVAVLRPTELLRLLGVVDIDAVPVDSERFYTYLEIFQIRHRLLNS